MRSMHRRLSWLIACWLIACTVAATAASIEACAAPDDSSASAACTCAHAAGADCPMHHGTKAPKPRCSCRTADEDGVGAMLALLGPVAVLPAAAATSPLATITFRRRTALSAVSVRPSVPDPPPPRCPHL